jgi:hypothetical protein
VIRQQAWDLVQITFSNFSRNLLNFSANVLPTSVPILATWVPNFDDIWHRGLPAQGLSHQQFVEKDSTWVPTLSVTGGRRLHKSMLWD